MKPILEISGFEHGIIIDPTIPAKNAFSFCEGVDIHTDPGYLQASVGLVKDVKSTINANKLRATPYWMERFEGLDDAAGTSQCDYYALGQITTIAGGIYGKLTPGIDTWRKLHTNTQNTERGGLKGFGSTLYYCSDAYLGRTLLRTLKLTATAGSTEIHVSSVEDFPASGDIVVEGEVIAYTGTDDFALTGCTRGQSGTLAATHTIGDVVMGFHDTYKVLKAQDNLWHPMEEYIGKLMAGDGRYVATLDADGTYNDDALILPKNYRISKLKVFNDKLVVGTYIGTNFFDSPESQLFTWNGVTDLPEETWNLKDSGISALEVWKNNLIVFAGTKGNIYQFNGANLSKLKTIPGITFDTHATVYPDATSIVDGNLLFGLSGVRNEITPGIYSLGQTEVGKPIALTLKHVTASGVLSSSANNLDIGSIFPRRSDLFYAGIYDQVADDDFQINSLSSTGTKISSGTRWESQIYNISRDSHPGLLRGVETVMDNTDGTITIKYKLDNASSWSTLGEADYQHQLVKGINERAEKIQIRCEFECFGTVSPKVSVIRIY